ncbi:MAG: GNAT family N-acetyltransferase [Anaerolineae bacterium]
MRYTIDRIAHLEWINYAATQAIAQHTPGLTLQMRDDAIITASQTLPAPDTTHACLLRATPHTADNLIAELKTYFGSRGLPTTLYLSPACTPADLEARLQQQGFVRQAEEAWLVLPNLPALELPPPAPRFSVKPIERAEAETFARVFASAFQMPSDLAPLITQLLLPTLGLPGVYHYLAWEGDRPVGTLSLVCYQNVGIIGSAGVTAARRGSRVASNLMLRAARDARRQGVDRLVLQTAANSKLERLLRISGFRRAFVRTGYTLP